MQEPFKISDPAASDAAGVSGSGQTNKNPEIKASSPGAVLTVQLYPKQPFSVEPWRFEIQAGLLEHFQGTTML